VELRHAASGPPGKARITGQTGDAKTSLARDCVTCQDGDVEFDFIADRPVLDFVTTVAERGTTHLEKLRTGTDLATWVAQSRIIDEAPAVTLEQLVRAKVLREALFALITSMIDGTRPRPDDRRIVNAAAAHPRPILRLSPSGKVRRSGDLNAVLAVLAADCLDLFDSPDRLALHWCADSTCTRPFIDRSRGHRRRWCGMKGCGDRAKAAAYRRRRSGHRDPA
jgi:predicted RNA-binding Zn ribbon-like protein